MSSKQRWPEYAAVLVQESILCALAIPFQLEGETKAAMNLYSKELNTFEGSMRDLVEAHVRQTSTAFRLAVRVAERTERANDLQGALESRTIIDLAVGIMMGQNRCTQDEAFKILKSASSTRNI